MKQYLANGSHSSPLTRGIKERNINPDNVSMRVYRSVQFDATHPDRHLCVRAEELAALSVFRKLQCPLLQRNAPVDTSAQRRHAAAFRARNPNYMRDYGRAYRQRKREERERQMCSV